MTQSKKWCRDISWRESLNQWILETMPSERETINPSPNKIPYTILDEWKFCPICGKPRPSEEDELVEELLNRFKYCIDERMKANTAVHFMKEKWKVKEECEHVWEHGHPITRPVKERDLKQCLMCFKMEKSEIHSKPEPSL